MAPSESPAQTTNRHESDLYTRPGWVDADVALVQLDQGKASGDRGILWVRGRIQRQLRSLGGILDMHAGKFLFVSVLAIATFSVGLKSMTFHSDIELLWAEPSTTPDSASPEMLSTHQMVIQTGADPDVNLLHPHGLLEHLALIHNATQVTVNMFDITWRLKDFCQSPSIPNFDAHYIEQIFENMMPCSIVTPLDCFWEGSKLLGPDFPVNIPSRGSRHGLNQLKWTNLNPSELITRFKQDEPQFDFHSLEDYLKRAGITTGYQEKPCLNPGDPECPTTAPNYNSSQSIDIGAELTSGCYGFAAKYMHWPEDLIVGGVMKNKSGHIKQAKALQTVVQLMGEHELYEYWSGHYKVHHIGWNQDKATLVLHAWQKKFAQEIEKLSPRNGTSYSFVTFSTANLNMILRDHSRSDVFKLGIVLVLVAVYGWMAQSAIAALGVIVLASCAAAALGVCSLIGLPMNLLSTHVLPFITVGLALRDMFLVLSTQTRNLTPPEVLLRTGPTIISGALINSSAFLAAAILPIPALRVFCLQCAVMVIFHGAALLIVFPSLLALQQRCRNADMPCFRAENNNNNNNNNNDPEHGTNLLTAELICQQKKSLLSWLVTNYLTSVLLKPFVKVILCLTYAILIIFCVFNGLKLEFDVRIATFSPKNTQEYRYLEVQNKYFGFYNFYLVTTELEYPLKQPLLHDYHSSLTKVPNVLKDSNGGLNMNDFWLANFRDFLIDLQQEFDHNRNANCVNSEKWFGNATEKAVLAFKLLAQTGIVEYPVDKGQIFKKRLVNNEGIIDSKAFYNYLSAWNSNDQMSYTSSQANLTPKPFLYYSSKAEYDLKIPKSQPLTYTQMPFYLKNLKSTGSIIQTLRQIKDITEEFNRKGMKNYPVGLIFAYFNQFLFLDRILAIQFLLTIVAAALVACVLIQWTKLWCPLFSTLACMLLMCTVNVNALSGTMGAIHFIIVSRNILTILTGFLSAIGNRERRLRMSLELNSEPILKGDIGLIICASVLATSQFEFIHFHLFYLIIVSVCGSLANSLVFFPLTLALIGPKAELQPLEHSDRISTPPPLPQPPPLTRTSSYSKPPRRTTSTKATREPSLTTITEESCNQSIVVEPQVTVEYSSPSPDSSSSGPYTTKVTATANIKVELVAPVYRSKCSKSHRQQCKCNRRQRQQQQCRCCKDSNSSDNSSSNAETEPPSPTS